MKRILLTAGCIVLIALSSGSGQQKSEQYTLESESITKEGQNLDSQINDLNKKIMALVSKYKLFSNERIKVLPYRFNYSVDKDNIEMERYVFIKDDIYNRTVVGIKSKHLVLYAGGQGVGKIRYKIYENNHLNGVVNEVLIEDPSPGSAGTDDMLFTHIKNGRKFLDSKKLSDVKNNAAFPLRNDIKRDFIIPHLSFFYDSLLFICESYRKSLKDSDHMMNEFLKKSTKF